MYGKTKKIITVLFAICFFIFNAFSIFVNIPVVNAQNNQYKIDDSTFLFNMVHASQRGGRLTPEEYRGGGMSFGGSRGGGYRLGNGPRRGPKRGGGKIAFNPTDVDMNITYNTYVEFIKNNFFDDFYYIPVNTNFYRDGAKNTPFGFHVTFPAYDGDYFNEYILEYSIPKKYNNIYIKTESFSTNDIWGYIHNVSPNRHFPYFPYVLRQPISDKETNAFYYLANVFNDDNFSSWTVSDVYLTNSSNFDINNIKSNYNKNNLPTFEEFVTNYNETFNTNYNFETDEFVENNDYFIFSEKDFGDENITINKEYITNNTTIINNEKPDYVQDKLDYTSYFERIIAAINNLSGGGSGEEGKGFWASLFDSISDLARSISDLLTGIPDLLISLLDGLLDLVEKIVALFIPTAEQMQELSASFSGLTDDLSLKFTPVTDTMNSIKSVFASPKSIYDLTYDYQGETFNVIPKQIQPQINNLKSLLNGAIVLLTFIDIYKRFVGREDVIK